MRLKEILKNDYVKSALLLCILVISVFVFWFGLRAVLRTEYPLCGVASGSMEPTLKVGDLIVVQGLGPGEINAAAEGDIIVFYRPKGWQDPNDLIVHRAVDEFYDEDDSKWYFKTKGDANSGPDPWDVPEDYLVGRVMSLRLPMIGFITFLMRTPAAILVILPMLALIIIDWIPLFKKRSES